MKIEQIPLGSYQTNCYLLINDNNHCLIVDPGDHGEKLIEHLESNNIKPQAIILTHTHLDHIGAVDVLRDHFQIEVYVHEKENSWLQDPALNGSNYSARPVKIRAADHLFTTDESYEIEEFKFQVLETPGHSPGSVSFYFSEAQIVFTGDALFQGSIGRTDLLEGNHSQLIKSIHDKLLVLSDDTTVLPGHGPTSTIGNERKNNPFL